MAKKALLDVLEQTIGKYVSNLDAESLNVAVWSGKIELHSLELDVKAVNGELDRQAAEAPNLALPFRVASGRFGSFAVDVPWANLMSKPVILRASNLTVELEPYDRSASVDYLSAVVENEASRAIKVFQQRKQSINLADDFRIKKNTLKELAEQDIQPNVNSTEKNSASFGSRLVRRIIENIQIEINGVHLKLRDKDCSGGIVLKSFQLVTTDQHGTTMFIDRTQQSGRGSENSFLYKSLSISGLGIYLDDTIETQTASHFRKSLPLSPIGEGTTVEIDETNCDGLDHSYILAPLSFQASLRQADFGVCRDFPRYFLNSELNALSILVSRRQIELANHIMQQIKPSSDSARPLFPEYRPLERVARGNAVLWWKYAVRCIGRLNGQRSWREFADAFRKRKIYIQIYKRFDRAESCAWIKPLSLNEIIEMEDIEMDRSISVEGIMCWRNTADAMFRKEQEKYTARQATTKKSIFTSLFGSSSTTTTTTEGEEPPISLSLVEMKELESIERIEDSELSIDSQLYDVSFVLRSFRVNLRTFGERQLAALDMGTVSTKFHADSDGSMSFIFAMASLSIHDKVTLNTLFPTVLKNQIYEDSSVCKQSVSPRNSIDFPKALDALRMEFNKTKAGHQKVNFRLSTFEAIASPYFFLELQRFVSTSLYVPKTSNNPVLTRSLSGSVDLFYDAADGASAIAENYDSHNWAVQGSSRSETDKHSAKTDLSNKLIDAWNEKREKKVTWTIDLDLQAPIVIVPESCVDIGGNLLVFDLGHLTLNYGSMEASGRIMKWFENNPRGLIDASDLMLDSGTLRITSLSFTVGKVTDWKQLAKKSEYPGTTGIETIIQPISLNLDFGIESHVDDKVPRFCLMGVLPTISLQVSHHQVSTIIGVSNVWKKHISSIISSVEDVDAFEDEKLEKGKLESFASDNISETYLDPRNVIQSVDKAPNPILNFYSELRLQRLSLVIRTENGGFIESNLVSVVCSTKGLSDGSFCANLCMGWFWILDRIEHSFSREQRLIAHSRLPGNAESMQKYDFLSRLEKLGVFEIDYVVSNELADLTFKQNSREMSVNEQNSSTIPENGDFEPDSTLDARFSSLFIVWNPLVVKILYGVLQEFSKSVNSSADQQGELLFPETSSSSGKRSVSSGSLGSVVTKKNVNRSSSMLVRAKMDGLHLSLNSAKDDLPLFALSMSSAEFSLLLNDDENRSLSLLLGELKVVSPEFGSTLPIYRNVLGLASVSSTSLLSVRYYSGEMSIAGLSDESILDCEAYGEIELSPLRMVYIHSQILALVEYATAGILGALTSQAASSAVLAAAELATSVNSKKIFRIRTSQFNLLLPTAAYVDEYFSVNLGSLAVEYCMTSDAGGKATLSLQDATMDDSYGLVMLEVPVSMDLSVILPPDNIGGMDEQAYRVDLTISNTPFTLTKKQYGQIFSMLELNVGEIDLFLRDALSSNNKVDENIILLGKLESQNSRIGKELSHAGIEIIDNPRRIYLTIAMKSLSLNICGEDEYDPIIRVSAVKALVTLNMFPDLGKKITVVTLQDLFCDDCRLKAFDRQQKSMIYQAFDNKKCKDSSQDVFVISYTTDEEKHLSSIDIKVGSPRFVLIPDAIADIWAFLGKGTATKLPSRPQRPKTLEYHDQVEINTADEGSSIEATFVKKVKEQINSTSFSMKTFNCSVIFVDLGTSLPGLSGSRPGRSVQTLAEAFVLGGVFHASMMMKSQESNGQIVNLEYEFHGEDIEAYTAFGQDLHSAVQILDPAHFVLYYESRQNSDSTKLVDVRVAAITMIDLTISMRNLALLNAITTSLSNCLDMDDENHEHFEGNVALSSKETERLEKLASALDSELSDEGRDGEEVINTRVENNDTGCQPTNPALITSHFKIKLTTSDIQVTFVNDLQGLDEALFRFSSRNFLANGQMIEGSRVFNSQSTFTAFDYNIHASLLADYFDNVSNKWKVLLLAPWEVDSKGRRGTNEQLSKTRPSTVIDIDSLPCHICFSEQFLMNLASANHMWTVYSAASASALQSLDQSLLISKTMRQSMAASAARTFVASLPYAVANHSGYDLEIAVNGENDVKRSCPSGNVEFFRFEPPSGMGSGGKRLYGQDAKFEKSVTIRVVANVPSESSFLHIPHLDSQLEKRKSSHMIGEGLIIVTYVIKEGKTITLHVSSGIEFHNDCGLPVNVSFLQNETLTYIGKCEANSRSLSHFGSKSNLIVKDGNVSKASRRVVVPVEIMKSFRLEYHSRGSSHLSFVVNPFLDSLPVDWALSGTSNLHIEKQSLIHQNGKAMVHTFDVICRPVSLKEGSTLPPRNLDPFVLQVSVTILEISGLYPAIDISVKPRVLITNRLPVGILLKSPMPYMFSSKRQTISEAGGVIHEVASDSYVEVYTPGPSIAVVIKCRDLPVGGTASNWIDGGWVDLPLAPEFRLREPLTCVFPFVRKPYEAASVGDVRGNEFFIVQGNMGLRALTDRASSPDGQSVPEVTDLPGETQLQKLVTNEDLRSFIITVSNYAVDHTGNILFEQNNTNLGQSLRQSTTARDSNRYSAVHQVSIPFGAFVSNRHHGRISMLPALGVPIRLLFLTMDGDEGVRRSVAFQIEDISICDGGIDSTPLIWENGKPSGFFAYRKLIGSYQSEIHVVPEYIVYNGSENHLINVTLSGERSVAVTPGKFAPIKTHENETAAISVEYRQIGGRTPFVRVDSLGLRVAIVKLADGTAIGSVAIQTVVGAQDSRLVVKLGDLQTGTTAPGLLKDANRFHILKHDFFRCSVRWSQLQLTLIEARPVGSDNAVIEAVLDKMHKAISPRDAEKQTDKNYQTWMKARQGLKLQHSLGSEEESNSICTILLHRFTVDWQRVFKKEDSFNQMSARSLWSPERSQLSIVIHHVQVKDETPKSPFPIVFDSTSDTSFFDLCIRTRGSTNEDLVQVDLVDLNLAHRRGVSEKMYLSTTEDFVWKLLDLFNRILDAAAEFAGVDIKLKWDDEQECFVASIQENENVIPTSETKYHPPKSDKLYDIKRTCVSPFTTIVSFRRNPQASRYKFLTDVKGGPVVNYFTKHLKFKIDKAELNFSRYEAINVKGPPDRVMELLTTVYLSRVKKKMVTIMTAASFQDWKYLASRDVGDDEFMEGDMLRVTGNLAGRTAGYVLRQAGKGVGGGVSNAASAVGERIENASAKIGARVIGAGVNSVVSGVGEGVGNAVAGVGTGAGKVLQGAGQGVGHIFGGISGGVFITGKGIVKGISSGDGKAAASGIAQGASTIGTGVGQGVESVVNGAAEGVYSVGHGLFSGVKTVGKGIGGAFLGKKSPSKKK